MAKPKSTLPLDEALTLLRTAPERIAAMVAGLSPEQLRTRPAPDEWSVVEILAHLRACADVWGAAIATILAEDHPTIRAVDPRTHMTRTDYPDLDFATSFAAYAAQRVELIALLQTLPPDAWTRTGTFTGSGAPIQRTLQSFATRLAIHERPHLKQIKRIADSG